MSRRVNVRKILADPATRRELLVQAVRSIQAVEGIDTTQEQAEEAYDRVQRERGGR